ncbi:hypothetical protein B7494_g3905 [Chlorociboria aeruginascens]|nr:hypothetical protein B7494_g3905 [Chlorociboria aeruginascens]
MRASLIFLAFATSVVAHGLAPRGNKTSDATTTETLTTFTTTTYCPVTQTQSANGTTKLLTTLTTSEITVTSCVGGCYSETTVPGPTETLSSTTEVLLTYTTESPVIVTKTSAGSNYTKVYTTTSTIETILPTTITQYTTLAPSTVTSFTEVFETTTCIESVYTTVSANTTIVETVTLTSTIPVTSTYTITSTSEPPTTKATVYTPITIQTSVPEYIVVTVPSERTATEGTTVYFTATYTLTSTTEPPTTKATVLSPITIQTSAPVTAVVTVPSEKTSTSGTVVFSTTYPTTSETTVGPPPTSISTSTAIVIPSSSTSTVVVIPTSSTSTAIVIPPSSTSTAVVIPTSSTSTAIVIPPSSTSTAVVIPTSSTSTSIAVTPPSSTTTPAPLPANAAQTNKPVAYAVAGGEVRTYRVLVVCSAARFAFSFSPLGILADLNLLQLLSINMFAVSKYLPFSASTTPVQAATYLCAICLFSISFLVFLNSSVSFVITDLIGIKDGVGDIVGTLGFADELCAVVACPIWGILSDRLGVRIVAVLGYATIGISLVLFVQARNVYPQLLLARILFAIGGAASATMVTAILPIMTTGNSEPLKVHANNNGMSPVDTCNDLVPSLDSNITITPEIHDGRPKPTQIDEYAVKPWTGSSPPRLAGIVGVFTGCGALVALTLLLPLPGQFSKMKGVTQGQAVADSFYVVGGIALFVACFCFLGLRNLNGEEGKGWRLLLGKAPTEEYEAISFQSASHSEPQHTAKFLSYWRLLLNSTLLGFTDARIGLGYLGGFVARASSVGISLFIPLYVNAYFIRNGFCQGSPNDPSPELKKECRAAYILAAELTGASQLIALVCAPVFGFLSDRYRRFNIPLLVAALFGIVGYTAFGRLISPEPKDIDGRGGNPIVFLIVALIGTSQIGAIVCSLGLLGRGVLGEEGGYSLPSQLEEPYPDDTPELAPLVPSSASRPPSSRSHLKGSIAGVYSLSGGAAILLLTKVGGNLFDSLSTGAPFYMMAIFNAVLLVIGTTVGIYCEIRRIGKDRRAS